MARKKTEEVKETKIIRADIAVDTPTTNGITFLAPCLIPVFNITVFTGPGVHITEIAYNINSFKILPPV